MVTIEENWHWYTEHQAIYNIHTINSSNEIMYLLEYLLLSLGLTYTPLSLLFSSFVCCLWLIWGCCGEALKKS